MSEVTLLGRRALIGRGFIGSSLDKPGRFTDKYNTTNSFEISGHYDLIVCAAPSAVKWLANSYPDHDRKEIDNLMDAFLHVEESSRVILISTIDAGLNKDTYGKNRRIIEEYIMNSFKNSLVVRLPALFGRGLQKNILYDLLNGYVDHVNIGDEYQWWNIDHLWEDLKFFRRSIGLRTLYSEPVPMYKIVGRFFPEVAKDSAYWEIEPQVKYNSVPTVEMSEEQVLEEMSKFIDQWRKEHVVVSNNANNR